MDAHHDIVQKAIAAAGDGSRLYFGYSTILDQEAFDEWRTQHGYQGFALSPGSVAEAIDVELVYDFPSRWWGGRVAGLSERPGSSVWGRVHEIREKDWPIIAHKEGGVTGMSVERPVTVKLNGQLTQATAFTTNPQRRSLDGVISVRFLEALVRGAKKAGLPPGYVSALESAGLQNQRAGGVTLPIR